MSRYQRQLEMGIAALAASVMLVIIVSLGIAIAEIAHTCDEPVITTQPDKIRNPDQARIRLPGVGYPPAPQGPNVSKCLDPEADTWDCIRHAMKRTDI